MTPELSEMDESTPSVLLEARARRIVVFVVVAIATLVVFWALIEGGDRDLWSVPSVVLPGAISAGESLRL